MASIAALVKEHEEGKRRRKKEIEAKKKAAVDSVVQANKMLLAGVNEANPKNHHDRHVCAM